MPNAEQRQVSVSATGLDRLRSDPYQFYANSILHLRTIEQLDAEPSAAWRGEAAHRILERWHKAGDRPGELHAIAEQVLDEMSAHPLMRALWRPRLLAALDWVDAEIAKLRSEDSRVPVAIEKWGDFDHRGVKILAKADRIDSMPDGRLAVVDYKTGQPPSAKMVEQGYSLQLGIVGLIADAGGFEGVSGEPDYFEYWSLAKRTKGDGFGFVQEPIKEGKKQTGIPREEFLSETQSYLDDALDRWILGSDPFTARLNPDLPSYTDYDQLMRLDEWLPHMTAEERDEA